MRHAPGLPRTDHAATDRCGTVPNPGSWTEILGGMFVGEWVDVVLLDDDAELADRAIKQLRRELAEHEIDMRTVETTPPGGSKGDISSFNAVAIALGGAGGMVTVLVTILRDWLGRRPPQQRVKLTIGTDSIELDAASPQEQQQALEAFLRRHEAS